MDDITVKLSPEQRNELTKFYTDKINDLQKQVSEARELLQKLNGDSLYRTKLVSEKNVEIQLPKNYHLWSVAQKIKYVLNQTNYCLTARQIVDSLKQFELDDKSTFYGTVSGTISNKINKKILFNRYREIEGGDFYNGLIEWFDENGNVLEQYRAK
jgi:hypothetical protein